MGGFVPISARTEEIARVVIDCAFRIHSQLGPGLLESVYEECLCYELRKRGCQYARQLEVPVTYEEIRMDSGFRLDILVEDLVIVEVKAVTEMHPVFAATTLTYLKMTGKRLALLINFHVPLIKDGIQRIIR